MSNEKRHPKESSIQQKTASNRRQRATEKASKRKQNLRENSIYQKTAPNKKKHPRKQHSAGNTI
jgi:hypothetical protein